MITQHIKSTETARDKFRALWLRLKSSSFDVSQGEALEMAIDAMNRELDEKDGKKE